MNRYGFQTTDVQKILEILKNNPQLNIDSVCSHLSSSNDQIKMILVQNKFSDLKTYVKI